MAKVACEDLDPEFNKNAVAGDIIVGGKKLGLRLLPGSRR